MKNFILVINYISLLSIEYISHVFFSRYGMHIEYCAICSSLFVSFQRNPFITLCLVPIGWTPL